jgi:hypothetical protein
MNWMPSLRTLRLCHFVAAVLLLLLVIITERPALALLQAVLAGYNIGAGLTISFLLRVQVSHREMCKAFGAMSELNCQLLAERSEFRADEPPPLQPTTLH